MDRRRTLLWICSATSWPNVLDIDFRFGAVGGAVLGGVVLRGMPSAGTALTAADGGFAWPGSLWFVFLGMGSNAGLNGSFDVGGSAAEFGLARFGEGSALMDCRLRFFGR